MPIYEYECRGCSEPFELLVRLSQIDAVRCPHCGSADLRRLMSVFGFTGKGIKSKPVGGGASCGSCAGGHCGTCSH